MHYHHSKKKEVLSIPLAKGYSLATTGNKELVELHLSPNGEVPAHALPINVTFYVITGQGRLTVDDKIFNATKGDVLSVNAMQQRSWLNNGVTELLLLVIKELPGQ